MKKLLSIFITLTLTLTILSSCLLPPSSENEEPTSRPDEDTVGSEDTNDNDVPDSDTETQTETEVGTEKHTEKDTDSKTERETETNRETESATESATESEAQTDPDSETESETESESATESETETETESETETETESDTESETESESDGSVNEEFVVLRYGRSVITGNVAYVYDLLEDAIMSDPPTESISVSVSCNVTESELNDAMLAFICDYPECFWLHREYSYSYTSSKIISHINLKYIYEGADLTAAKQELNSKVNEIIELMPEGSNFQKALYLHDAVANTIEYTITDNDQTAYGALVEGKAVCAGYAAAYQLLLHKVGINSFAVSGHSNGEAHRWNLVWIDDETCVYTDVTWNDPDSDFLWHYYFNMSLDEMNIDHVPTSSFILPECAHTEEDYYDLDAGNVITDDTSAETVASFFKKDTTTGSYIGVFKYDGNFPNWASSNLGAVASALGIRLGYTASYSSMGNEYMVIITPKYPSLEF